MQHIFNRAEHKTIGFVLPVFNLSQVFMQYALFRTSKKNVLSVNERDGQFLILS